MGIIEVLQRLLTADDKKIEIKKDEVIDRVFGSYEKVKIVGTWERYKNQELLEAVQVSEVTEWDPLGEGVEPISVLGPYIPTGMDDPYRVALVDQGYFY